MLQYIVSTILCNNYSVFKIFVILILSDLPFKDSQRYPLNLYTIKHVGKKYFILTISFTFSDEEMGNSFHRETPIESN